MSDAEKGYRLCPGVFCFCLCQGSTFKHKVVIDNIFDIIEDLRISQITDEDKKKRKASQIQNSYSDFKLCKRIGIGHKLLDNKTKIKSVKDSFEKEYEKLIKQAREFVKNTFNGDEKEKRKAIASIIKIIEHDDTINDEEEFKIGKDGTSVKKIELFDLKKIDPASFILGIWYYIITRKDGSGNPLTNNIGEYTINCIIDKTSNPVSLKEDFLDGYEYPFELLPDEADNDNTTQTSSTSSTEDSHRQILYQAETIIDPNGSENLMSLAEFANKNNINLTKSSHWRNLVYNPNIKYQNLNSDSAEFVFKIGEVCSIKTKCFFTSCFTNDEHCLSVRIQLGPQEWVGLLPFAVDTKENNDNTENASGWASQYARNWAVLKDAELEILFQVVNPISHTIHILLITTCSRKYNPTPIPFPSFHDLLTQDMYKNGAEIGRILRQSQYPLFWDKSKSIDEQKLALLTFPDDKLTQATLDLITNSVFFLFEKLDEEQSSEFRCGLYAEGGCIAETVLLNMAHLIPSFRSASLHLFTMWFDAPNVDDEDVKKCISIWSKSSKDFELADPFEFRSFDEYTEYRNSSEWTKLRNENKYYLDRLYISNASACTSTGCNDKPSILLYYMGKSSLEDNRLYSAYGFIQKSIIIGLENDSAQLYKDAEEMLLEIKQAINWSTDKQNQIEYDLEGADEFHELSWLLDEYDWPYIQSK